MSELLAGTQLRRWLKVDKRMGDGAGRRLRIVHPRRCRARAQSGNIDRANQDAVYVVGVIDILRSYEIHIAWSLAGAYGAVEVVEVCQSPTCG